VPAAACGLVGLKPTRGRTPATPAQSEGLYGLTYEFALTRSLRDCATLLDLVHGPGLGAKYEIAGPGRPYATELGQDPGRLRAGLMTAAWSASPVDPACAQAAATAGRVLEQLGHLVETAGPAVDAEALLHTYTVLTTIAVGYELDRAGAEPSDGRLEAVSRTALREAREMTGVQAAAAFNISGHPAISLPLGQTADQVPIGVQVVARYGREDLLFRVASQLEQALPWAARRPPPADHGELIRNGTSVMESSTEQALFSTRDVVSEPADDGSVQLRRL
jgi:amidase